jgi:hypothetical protein
VVDGCIGMNGRGRDRSGWWRGGLWLEYPRPKDSLVWDDIAIWMNGWGPGTFVAFTVKNVQRSLSST